MKILGWEELFGQSTGKRNKKRSLEFAVWKTLEEDTWFNGIEYAKGSRYKIWETENFGWVAFAPDSKTPDGNTPGKRIHKF